jgi:hypothetical protein
MRRSSLQVILLAVAVATVAGCSSIQREPTAVEDWRYPKSGICPIHKVAMHTRIVPNCSADCINFTPEYGNASDQFPFAGIEYGPSMYGSRRGMIFVCPECRAARRAWVREHGYGGFAPLAEIEKDDEK